MPVKTVPLVGSLTARGWAKAIGTSQKDQQYINCLFDVSENKQAGTKNVYAIKRAGSSTSTTIASGVKIQRGYASSLGAFGGSLYSAGTTVYSSNATAIGTVASGFGDDGGVADTNINNQTVLAFIDAAGSGYFVYDDAVTTNFPTFSGDTHTNTVIDGIASTTGIYPGQKLSGTGIVAGTRVETITSATAITVDTATTGTATVTITKEAIAKITDADFPDGSCVSIEAVDGYLFAARRDGRIFNCQLNAPSIWQADWVIAADWRSDGLYRVFKVGMYLVALGTATLQYFQITGNSSGSVLSRSNGLMRQSADLGLIQKPVYDIDGNAYSIDNSGRIYKFSPSGELDIVNNNILSETLSSSGLSSIGTATIGTKNLLCFFSGSATEIAVYDPETGMPSVVTMGAAITSSFKNAFTKSAASTLFAWASGDSYTDSSSAYTMTIQTEPLLLNRGKPFIINSIELMADNQASGTTGISCSGDDYASFSTERTYDMTVTRKRLTQFGQFRSSVAIKLTHAANTAWRGQALVIDWEPCD